MKIHGPFYLVKGEGTGLTASTPPARLSKTGSREADPPPPPKADIVRLVQSENQRALLPDPESLAEAKDLVSQAINNLKSQPEEQLEKVHRLEPGLLLRLL